MQIKKLAEYGYKESILGLSLSYNISIERAEHVASLLHEKDGGHNKFLESIYTWWDIKAPRYWWQEADTYRVGCSKQSESTMHTLVKAIKELSPSSTECEKYILDNFEPGSITPEQFNSLLLSAKSNDLLAVKKQLPEGFLQRRVWCMNYKTLRNIILQRREHKLPYWQEFVKVIYKEVTHPELLPNEN